MTKPAILLLALAALASAKFVNLTKNEFAAEVYYLDDNNIQVNLVMNSLPSYKNKMYMAIGFGSSVARLADWWVCKHDTATGTHPHTSVTDHMANGTIFVNNFDPPVDTVDTSTNTLDTTSGKTWYDDKKGWSCYFSRPRISADPKYDMSFGKGQEYNLQWMFGKIDDKGNMLYPNKDTPGERGSDTIDIKEAFAAHLSLGALAIGILSVFAF